MADAWGRWRGTLVFVLALGALAFWLRPVLVYHLTVAPDLVERGFGDRLEARVVRRFDAPPADWPSLRVANLELRAPISGLSGANRGDPCRDCGDRCRLGMRNGSLAVFPDLPEESLAQAFDMVPSASEIVPWRSRARNWQTLIALASRAPNPRLPESFRFEGRKSRGIVTVFDGRDAERFVVYAYGAGGTPTRTIGLVSVTRAVLHTVLGSLQVRDARADPIGGDRAARCLM